MKAKLFTKDMVFIDVIDISQISFKRQRNKEYTISCKPIADKDYNWEQVSFIYFLDDNEEKTKRIQYKPCGYLEGYNGESLSIKSMESYLESISVIPENFEWWQNKLLKNVLPDLCYGFRRIKKASLSEMQDVATSYHVKFDVLENGNGEVYADTGYYFSPSNTHELYYYSDGYVIYRMTLPAEARRQGLVLRWSDQTGTTTDVSVQFRWSNVSSDFIGTYSAEQSPLRGEVSRKNETVGVDIPESDNTYLFIKFNLKYDTGSTSVFQKGYNYEQEITTVQGEGEENYVYYGKTAILNAFEVIYRVDTRIEEGTISVSDTQLMQADLSNCNSLLSVLKAISEAYKLTFFVSFEENIPLLNVYNEYINDTTNQTIITDKINSTVTRKEIKTETLQAVEAFGIGNGFDRIHAFVKADDLESNIKNIGKYEGEETSVEELITNAKAYIKKENEELSSASFEYYNIPLQVNDKVRVVINKNVYTSLITEENYSFDGDKTKKEYTIGIRKYAFSGFFTSPFSGLFLYKPETPTNLIATRMEQGWAVSWQGKTSRYILQYRRSSISPWNTISITGTNCTIPFTEYDIDYTFAIYAVDDKGQYSDAMYIYSNSSSEAIYVWETYHDGDTQPDTPTGSGTTGGWHRDLTQNAKWVSKKEAHRITEGSWSVPFLTSNGVRLGVLDDTPDDVTGLIAVAMKDGIQISCNAMGVGAKNVVSSFEFELLLEGESEWIPISSFTNSAFYTFNRSTIGYPEASDLDGSQVRCKVKNTYNYYSTNYATASVNTDGYGTWIPTAPVLSPYASKRDFTVSIAQGYSARQIYGDTVYRAEIKRYDDVDYYKPNLTADPYESEENYKDGTGYVTVTSYIQQRVPLENQATDPQSTSYTYRFTTVNATTGIVGASATVTLIASASTAQDIVNHSMDAEKFNVQDLAAVSTVFGSIRSDGIAKDSTNFWNLSDPASTLGYGQEGEMCVGTSASVEVFDPVTNPAGYKDTDSFFHFVPQNTGSVLKGLYLKLANFIVTAISSTITGLFEVVQRQTAKTIFKVDDVSEYTSGIQTETSITRVDDDAPLTNTIIDKLTRKSVVINSVVYHLVPDEPILLIQNLSTGIETQVATPILFKGIHNIGGILHAIGAGDTYSYVSNTWTQISIDWISTLVVSDKTLSASSRGRWCCVIKDNFLYIPADGTVLEVVDLTTFTVQDNTISASSRQRRCCAIKDNFLYIPIYNGTVLEVVDLTTFTVQDKILSATNRGRVCCAIKDNYLYIPIDNATVLEVVDLTNFTVQDKTIFAYNRLRWCCVIKDNFLYIPTYVNMVLEVVDLTTFTVQIKTLSASNRARYFCVIKDNFLYIPINGTVLEVVDLTTFTVQDKTISSVNRIRYGCAIKDNFLYIPAEGTILEVVDLTNFIVQEKTLSATNRYRICCAIKGSFLYIPTYTGTVLEVVAGLPYLQHKTTTNNTTHILSTSTGVIETIKASNGEYVSLPAPDISGSPLSITIGAISFFPDFATGKITKYNAGTITTVNTTARANIKTLITDGTNMFISGLGNVIYKVAQDGTQTALTLSQLSTSIYHTLGIIGTKMYVIPEMSSPRFAEVNLSTFALIQYALFSPSWGALRGEGFIYNSKYWLAEKNTKKQHRLAGIKEALSDIKTLKPIGSGFIERTINIDGTTKLETADGERVIFDADKNLIAPTATTAQTATIAGRAKDSYPIPTDAVLQYSFDEIKQLPDNPAGTVYLRDNDWTTVDGWYMGGNATLNVQDGYIRASRTSTSPFGLQRIISGSVNKLVVLIIRAKTPSIVYCARPAGELYAQKLIGTRWTLYSFIKTASIDDNGIYIYTYGDAGSYFDIKSIYIGDGSYLEPVIDNSYSEAHAENHGVIPVDGVCGKAGYFNNSYMIAPRPTLSYDITIYFWAKFDALGTQTIVQSRTVVGQGLSVFQITNNYRLDWRGNLSTFTGYTPPVNTWHHVCIKMNATTAILKINGETKVTRTGTYGVTENLASTIWSGMSGTGGTPSGNPLTGALDGLKVVPRFTTDDEDIGEYKARANHPKFYATADKWKTARNITISDADGTNTGTAISVDGSENETLKLPATIKASLTGNASTATKLATARKINGVDFDGTADIYNPYLTLIWTNPSLATARGAFKATFDVTPPSQMTAILVEINYSTTVTDKKGSMIIPLGSSGVITVLHGSIAIRPVSSIVSDGVNFATGGRYADYGVLTSSDIYGIPTKIWAL